MAIIAVGFDDVLLSALKTKLETFETREAAISSAVAFKVEVDNPDPWNPQEGIPLVNLTIDSDTSDPTASSSGHTRQGTLTVKAQCIAPKNAARLRYLKQQVLAGLFSVAVSPYLGFKSGEINISWPSWSHIEFESVEQRMSVFAGEWTFSVKYAWEPEEVAGTAISEYTVKTDQWEGVYVFPTT
jgi:hypothetical protein